MASITLFHPASRQFVAVPEEQKRQRLREGYLTADRAKRFIANLKAGVAIAPEPAIEEAEPEAQAQIKINSCPLSALDALPGVSMSVAKAVRDARPLRSFEELEEAVPSMDWNAFVDVFDFSD